MPTPDIPPPERSPISTAVRISVEDGLQIDGDMVLPTPANGLVLFAHGSGSSRNSPRNRQVARILNARRLGTLLLDLLTSAEERQRANVFDVDLLAGRLMAATRWVQGDSRTGSLPVGYFGASTGAAAALMAAAELVSDVRAVVSRGGRPDMAGRRLPAVRAPVLLIVGGDDRPVLELNRDAQRLLPGASELAIVPGATHLFEEPGALDQVSGLAADWFERYVGGRPVH